MAVNSFVTGDHSADDASPQAQGEFDTDVLVVGTGPMGATTALLLATYGIRATAISNHRWLANTPRAHITNQRAAEVFRDAGMEDELKRHAMPWDQMAATYAMTSLAGAEVARIPSWGGGDRRGDYRKASPSEPMDLPQTFLEPAIVNRAAARGARIVFSTVYLGHDQDANGVTVRLRDRVTGHESTVRARYLVGADGGGSTVAANEGIEFIGEKGKAGTVYARFTADLSQYTAHRPGVLYLMLQPDVRNGDTGTGILRCVRPWNEWIAGWGFDPRLGDPDVSDETAMRRIRAYIGSAGVDVELTGTSVWFVNEQYAAQMSRGRVFIGGDAAHRHPPNNGLGSNTCVQDAFNLAWKLAYVIDGKASPSLLDSYDAERQPIARQIVLRANRSRSDFAALKEIFEDPTGPEPLDQLDDPGSHGGRLRSRLAEAIALKNYEYSAHGVELNQRYQGAAVLDDGSEDEIFERDPELYAQPTTRPGAKLPHVWLVDANGREVSTLDVVGRGRMTLVTGLSGTSWTTAAEEIGLDTVVFGSEGLRDVYGAWSSVRDMEEGGALLVRPDGYIAWRARAPEASDAAAREALDTALHSILGMREHARV